MCEKRERNRERDYAKSRGGVGLESVYRLIREGVVTEFEVTGFNRGAPARWSDGCLDAPDYFPAGGCNSYNGRPLQVAVFRGLY